MAQGMEIVFDKRQIAEVERLLAAIPKGFQKAASRALNRTGQKARSWIVKQLAEDSGLKQKNLRKMIKLRKATYSRLVAVVTLLGESQPLIRFGGRQTRKGVTFIISKSQGRKVLKHAFIATMKEGHAGVFRRVGAMRLPIVEHYGPAVTTIYEYAEGIAVDALMLTGMNLEENLNDQVKLLLAKHGRAA